MSDRFDQEIKLAAMKYLHGVDWRVYKAQLIQESGLNPHALNSASGAAGIAQFMPATWLNMVDQLGLDEDASVYDGEQAIQAGAYYMSRLCASWTAERPKADRYALALASYNCGFGTMLNAQRKAGGANSYAEIIKGLSSNNTETPDYVRRIFGMFNAMVLIG